MQMPDPSRPLKIGTRSSVLALKQAEEARARLMAAWGLPEAAFLIVPMSTKGDREQGQALKTLGGKGLFTEEIEADLASGALDIAVHSTKDMPTQVPAGLALDCFLPREDVRDAFVGAAGSLAALAEGAVVGTSSLRRRAQVLHRRPDLRVVEFRGNVQTRLRKLQEGVAEATFLAMAGLNRLGLADAIPAVPIPAEAMLPAVGQGAIVIERRADDHATAALLEAVADATTAARVAAERAFLAALDGSCQTPIAALAELEGDRLRLRGEILRPDGSECLRREQHATAADGPELGRAMALELLAEAGPGFFAHR